jgi:hypothetical protein
MAAKPPFNPPRSSKPSFRMERSGMRNLFAFLFLLVKFEISISIIFTLRRNSLFARNKITDMQFSNFLRMIALAEETFSARTDPKQLDVNEEVINKLHELHPATLSEHTDGDGPVVWILVIPTTQELMNRFLKKEIGESELLELTKPGTSFDAIYLCSALVLPEFRKKGIAYQLTLDAIRAIRKDHPLKSLFVWPFSEEGKQLARKIAKEASLPLSERDSGIH